MLFLSRVIRRQMIFRTPPLQLRFNFTYLFYNISHNPLKNSKSAHPKSFIIQRTLPQPIAAHPQKIPFRLLYEEDVKRTIMNKKFFITLLSLLLMINLCIPPSPPVATAASQPPPSGSYACICTDDVYFYSVPSDHRGIFLLPKTYYVKILDYQSEYCKIEYLYDDVSTRKIIGYVKTSQLTFVDYLPRRPYLYYVFEVEYHIGDGNTGDSGFLDTLTATCAYYGDYQIGTQTYCYVLRDNTFGYIPKPATLYYEENSEYRDWLASQKETENTSSSLAPDSSPAQIAILIALCLLVPILAAMIIKPPKKPPYDTDL